MWCGEEEYTPTHPHKFRKKGFGEWQRHNSRPNLIGLQSIIIWTPIKENFKLVDRKNSNGCTQRTLSATILLQIHIAGHLEQTGLQNTQ